MAINYTENSHVEKNEIDLMLSVPAVFANKIYATTTQGGIRLTFAEEADSETVAVRTSVFLPFQNMFDLKEILESVAGNLERVELPLNKG